MTPPTAAPPFDLPGAPPMPPAVQERLRAALAARPPDEPIRTRHRMPDGTPRYVNRLLLERSPYLRQHAHNPVDWHPWGPEAFALAQRLGRPVLLSIGYATCHWCHVMEEESFEDLAIARYINAHYVAIKVDREERPDVDDTYMGFVQMLTGRGGWPMTVWLTPDGRPFFGGTYFPPHDGQRGRARGFATLLREMAQAYQDDPEGVADEATQYAERLRRAEARWQRRGNLPGPERLRQAVDRYWATFDTQFGGFGRGTKFPRPAALAFLLRMHRWTQDPRAARMVRDTLEAMRLGGIHDHVEGGFHRYTIDRRWQIPHFEKMLYDNAQLALVYLEAGRAFAQPVWIAQCREVLDYLLDRMQAPGGAFYSATDADSPQGEGAFATWTPAEVREAVGPQRAPLVLRHFGITEHGNFAHGRTVLRVVEPLDAAAQALGIPPAQAHTMLAEALDAMRLARARRPQPLRDDKILTAWNALAISALARAGLYLDESRYVRAAVRATTFVLDHLRRPDGRLWRRWRDGEARHAGVLDDHAFFEQALLDLFEADPNPRWLEAAMALQAQIDAHFGAPNGAYHLTADDAEPLLVRATPVWDGALPSGNAVAATNLLRLAALRTDDSLRERARHLLEALAPALAANPTAMPATLTALQTYHDRMLEVVLVVPPGQSARPLLDVLAERYLPNHVLVRLEDTPEAHQRLAPLTPLATDRHARSAKPTAYVCERGTCKRPTTSPKTLAQQLTLQESR